MADTTTTTEDTETLYDLLFADLELELSSDTNYNATALQVKLKQAIREVKAARKYPTTYTDDMIDSDMDNYYAVIRDIALYDYNQIGADFQESHNENETDRTWVSRDSLFSGVYPISVC